MRRIGPSSNASRTYTSSGSSTQVSPPAISSHRKRSAAPRSRAKSVGGGDGQQPGQRGDAGEVGRREQRQRERGGDERPGGGTQRPPGGEQAARERGHQRPGEDPVQQPEVAREGAERGALVDQGESLGRRLVVEPERQDQHDARHQHQRGPDERVAAPARARRLGEPDADGEHQQPRRDRVRPRVDRVQRADRQRGGERLGDAAPDRVAAWPGERDLQGEAEREQRERQREEVRVQVAEQEREPRELGDRVRDHARRARTSRSRRAARRRRTTPGRRRGCRARRRRRRRRCRPPPARRGRRPAAAAPPPRACPRA